MRTKALDAALDILKTKATKSGYKSKAEGITYAVEFIESENIRVKKLREYRRAQRKNKIMQSTGPLQ